MKLEPLVAAWRRRWCGDTTHLHYGVFRILFLGGFFLAPFVLPLQATRLDLAHRLAAGTDAFSKPVLLLRVTHLPLGTSPTLGWLMIGLAFTAMVGIATRISLIAVAGLYLYLGSIGNSFGFIAHDTTVPALVLVVLAGCPGVTSLSVDAWLRSNGRPGSNWTGRRLPVPRWPARTILVLLALAYFSSGYSKVREAGWDWANGKTLQAYLSDPQPAPFFIADPDPDVTSFRDTVGLESFAYSSGTPRGLAVDLAQSRPLMAALALVTLMWEITFPLVLVIRRLLVPYLVIGLLFHLSVAMALGLTSFYTYPLTYLVFVDWNALWDRVRAGAAPRQSALS